MIRKRKNVKNVMKKMAAFTLTFSLGMGLISVPGTKTTIVAEAAETTAKEYNYGRAWQQTLMFYEFQKSGDLSNTIQRNNWKGNSCVNDGADVGLDLTGGWYDAGDHVKFNLPMSYSATMLAWSYIVYEDTYKEAGQDVYMLDEIKWVNDYFIKCHPEENVYYYQVGNGDVDHQFWGAPELLELDEVINNRDMVRPSYKVTNKEGEGGSAVCAGTAASLAAASIIFKESDPEYSELCLKHADELYTMALEAMNDDGYQEYAMGYYTSTHFQDELTWGGAWLYKATGEEHYLETAKSFGHSWGGEEIIGNLKGNVWTQCWDDVRYGAMLLIAQMDDSEEGQEYRDGIEYNLDYWSTGVKEGNGTTARGKYTPNGLVMINDWGSLRYASAEANLAAMYCNWEDADPERVEGYMEFAKSQADYILGSTGRSYIVGYDETSPENPHHRTAHGAWKNSPLGYPDTNRHVLVGALVGGPRGDETYEDDRNNYCTNEVACDYNASVVGLMAAMHKDYGEESDIDPDLNAIEEVTDEYYMDGCNYQKGDSFCEVKLTVENHTAWPARGTSNLMFRYFVNIKDVLEQGYTAEDFNVICYYAQRKLTVTELIPWNVDEGIYYVEVALGQDENLLKTYEEQGISYTANGQADSFMYPCGDVECRCDMQLRIEAPTTWDYSKSPTYSDIAATEVDEKAVIQNVGIYEDNKLVGGIEPSKEGEVIIVPPTTEEAATNTSTEATTGTSTEDVTGKISVTSIRLNETRSEMLVGEKRVIQAIITPDNATDKTVTWESSDPSVATVSASGEVTAVSVGTAVITATTNDGKLQATNKLAVVTQIEKDTSTTEGSETVATTENLETTQEATTENPNVVKVDSITLSPLAGDLVVGDSTQMTVTILPTDATDKTLTWISSNPEVATVDAQGKVTAVAAGETTIKVTTNDGAKTVAAKVVVIEKGAEQPGQINVESVTLNKLAVNLTAGEIEQLIATVLPEDATDKTVSWASSDEKVAVVDSNGLVIGVAAGEADITVTTADGRKTSVCTVSVKEKNQGGDSEHIPATNIILNTDAMNLMIGASAVISATVLPLDATDSALAWSSDNEKVATVDELGKVTGLAEGTAKITVMNNADADSVNSITATCTVTVKKATEDNVSVTGITLNKESETMAIADNILLKATISPEDATNQNVNWSSSNEAVAVVDSNGKVTAIKEGKVIIIATTVDGGQRAYCNITVTDKTDSTEETKAVEGVVLQETSKTMLEGTAQRLKATILPTDATNQNVNWTSDNEKVAMVDSEGVVTAHVEGTAKITVTTVDGNKTAVCTITVSKEVVEVTNVILNTGALDMKIGATAALTATVFPENATTKDVVWSTSNDAVVSVDTEGNLTAKSVGKAVITVTTVDGSKTAICNIQVKEDSTSNPEVVITEFDLDTTSLELEKGEKKKLNAIITPEDATNKNVVWTSVNPKVVTVDEEGNVTALAEGQTVIIATTVDGGFTAVCNVTVKEQKTDNIAVAQVKLQQEKVNLTVGEKQQLNAWVLSENATNSKLGWETTDAKIVTVDAEGMITAVGEGSAFVIVTAEDGGYNAICTVIVTKKTSAATTVKVSDIKVNASTITLTANKTKTIGVQVLPTNATNKQVTYTSSNTSIATVDAQGKVKAKISGVCTITISSKDGIKKTVTVKVKPAKVSNLKKKSVKASSVRLTWKKQKGVTGYKVYKYNTKSKKYKLYKTVKKNTNYLTVKKLKSATTYKFKVRAYTKTSSGTMYGSYSKVLKVKTKK